MSISSALQAAGIHSLPFARWVDTEFSKPYRNPVVEGVFQERVVLVQHECDLEVEKVRAYRIGIRELVVRFPKVIFKHQGGLKKVRYGLLIQTSSEVRIEEVALGIFGNTHNFTEYNFAAGRVFNGSDHLVQHRGAFEYVKEPLYFDESVPTKRIALSKFYNLGDLEAVAQLRSFNERGCLDCMRQILCGLQGLHKKGYVHRDLKLANVFVENNSGLHFSGLHFAIGDFDFVQRSDGEKGKIGGTTEMMPPEYFYFLQETNRVKDLYLKQQETIKKYLQLDSDVSNLLMSPSKKPVKTSRTVARCPDFPEIEALYQKTFDIYAKILKRFAEYKLADWNIRLLIKGNPENFAEIHFNIQEGYKREIDQLPQKMFDSKIKLEALDLWSLGLMLDHLRECLRKDSQWISEILYPKNFWFFYCKKKERPLKIIEEYKTKFIDFYRKSAPFPAFLPPAQQETAFMGLLRELIQGFLAIDPEERLKLDRAIEMLNGFQSWKCM
jgi:serine/threonine protein kinase